MDVKLARWRHRHRPVCKDWPFLRCPVKGCADAPHAIPIAGIPQQDSQNKPSVGWPRHAHESTMVGLQTRSLQLPEQGCNSTHVGHCDGWHLEFTMAKKTTSGKNHIPMTHRPMTARPRAHRSTVKSVPSHKQRMRPHSPHRELAPPAPPMTLAAANRPAPSPCKSALAKKPPFRKPPRHLSA